ncbi:hypothetical protein ACHAXS_005564 [Conticribra weissflogii]
MTIIFISSVFKLVILMASFHFAVSANSTSSVLNSTDSDGKVGNLTLGTDRQNDVIQILGLLDSTWKWGPELFNFTMSLIRRHDDGWHDDILNDGRDIDWSIRIENCDGTNALKEYWDFRTMNSGIPPHGVVGCRCSASSTSVASVAGLEGVPQISPDSVAFELSDVTKFPSFARVRSTDGVDAFIAMLRGFGWQRVTLIQTDTVYSNDFSSAFQQNWIGRHSDKTGEWKGEIGYSYTITLRSDGLINEDSARQALNGVPTDNPSINARVILLVAQPHQAFPILRLAKESGFQSDTVWAATTGWAGWYPTDGDSSWISQKPGFIGFTPYRNRDQHYRDFLKRFNEARVLNGLEQLDNLPDYASEHTVDAILALTMGLSAVSPENRKNGTEIMKRIIGLEFNGVSGHVSFTAKGDRKDALYSIFNFYEGDWKNVGTVGIELGSAVIDLDAVCFAGKDCGIIPSDMYPIPPARLQEWVVVVISIIAFVLACVLMRFFYLTKEKKKLESQMTELEKKMAAISAIDDELVDINKIVEDAKQRQASLIKKRAALQETPETWSKSDEILVLVPPEDGQYWKIFNIMRETIPNVHISQLWRVQNDSLWSYYSFHRDRLGENGIQANERRVWHGTSALEPSVIYQDKMDGFMMQFAAQGLWGRGIYFADKASYSKNYSYKPPMSSSTTERPDAREGELEMFLTRLLIGKDIKLDQNRLLTVPPPDPSTGLKYNTVTGETQGSQVWIVYGK